MKPQYKYKYYSKNTANYYRGYHIYYDPPPVTSRAYDWHFEHEDYDGAPLEFGGPPADNRAGSASSVEECKKLIDELEDE